VFALGIGLSIIMAWRSQIGGDQRLMLNLGWQLVNAGEWLPYGMPTSAGGRSPGGLMGLVMAVPLWIWRDYRAPALFTSLAHVGAFLVLLHSLKDGLSRYGLWLLLLLVWLNPWRMYFSAHIWNSNFMFVAAVLHLASSQRMYAQREAWNSCLHVLLIALAMQLHTSAAVLGVLSLLLFYKRMIKVHWGGFALGVVLSIAAYVPWVVSVSHDPTLAPGEKGFFLRGLLYVFPLVRGILYWLKMSSLVFAGRMVEYDFTYTFGASANSILMPTGKALELIAYLTLIPSAWLHWRFARKMWPILRANHDRPLKQRSWLERYAALSLAAALFAFAISPTTVMFWQVFISIPAATLVFILAVEALAHTRLRTVAAQMNKAWWVLTVLLLLFQTTGSPQYHCGGREAGPPDAMMQALHVPAECY
jgi:hypothetical protein